MGEVLLFTGLATPSNFPAKVELKNPDALANIQFGTFNTTTGAKTSNTSVWLRDANGVPYTSTAGTGLTLTVYGGIAISAYAESTSRTFKVFVDGTLDATPSYTSSPSAFAVRYQKSFTDAKAHTVTIVYESGGALYIDYLQLFPSNIVPLSATKAVYPRLSIVPAVTTVRHTPQGKTKGDTTHPVTIKYGGASSMPASPASVTLENESTYYNVEGFRDDVRQTYGTSTLGYNMYVLIENNLKASKSGIPSAWTVAEIEASLTQLLQDIWAYGSGPASAYGVEIYVWDGSTWGSPVASHTQSTIQLLTWLATTNLANYVDSNGKIYVLIKSTQASDGTTASNLYIDSCAGAVSFKQVELGSFAENTGYNLVPPFSSSNWTKHPRLVVTSDYTAEVDPQGATYNSSYFSVPALPNTMYSLSGTWSGYINVYNNVNSGTAIASKRHTAEIAETITFTTPIDCHTLWIRFGNETDNFLCRWLNIHMYIGQHQFAPRKGYTYGLSTAQKLINGSAKFDGTGVSAKFNTTNITLANNSALKVEDGFNYLRLLAGGGLMTVSVVDEGTAKIAAFDKIYIPNVNKVVKGQIFIGDTRRTVYGKKTTTYIGTKAKWDIETAPLTRAEADVLLNYLATNKYKAGLLWLDTFGSAVNNTVSAEINPDSIKETRFEFQKDNVWHNDGLTLSLTIEEV